MKVVDAVVGKSSLRKIMKLLDSGKCVGCVQRS